MLTPNFKIGDRVILIKTPCDCAEDEEELVAGVTGVILARPHMVCKKCRYPSIAIQWDIYFQGGYDEDHDFRKWNVDVNVIRLLEPDEKVKTDTPVSIEGSSRRIKIEVNQQELK
jgi:hypothetical protein